MAKIAETMRSAEFWELVANRYSQKPATLRIYVGCHELPNAKEPIGLENIPEFAGTYSVDLGHVRRWAGQKEKAPNPNFILNRISFKIWFPILFFAAVIVFPSLVFYVLHHVSR